MKKVITIFLILTLINPPLWATQSLSPDTKRDWAQEKIDDLLAIAPLLYILRGEKEPARIQDLKSQIEEQLRSINATPYWNTLLFNPDNTVEIVIDYRVKDRSNLVINRFSKTEENIYNVEVIRDEPQVNNRIARGSLGLNLRVPIPAQILEEVKQVGLPKALQYIQEDLLKESPGIFAYRNLVTEEEPVKEVLGVIENVQKRIGAPIKAVVVLGIGGQSLGNKAVVQVLGSQEIRFIFPDNIANPEIWFTQLEGINPENILLYVSSKTGSTDETMTNFWFFWEWLINKLGQPQVANRLLEKLKKVNLAQVKLNELIVPDEEKMLLQMTLNRMAVSTTPEKQGPLYFFALNNNIPIVNLPLPIEGRYTILSTSGQFTTGLAGHNIEAMRNAILPLAASFKEESPELNPALESAIYAYAVNSPILVGVSINPRLSPLFEWTRQLVNESLGKENKGPYFTFAVGEEGAQALMKAPKDKLFLVINVGEERLKIPEGVSAIELNIPEINAENLARIFLFLEEFTVRYGSLLGVNPVNQPWVDRFKGILTEKAKEFGTTPEERQTRQEKVNLVKEFFISGGLPVPEGILTELTKNDTELITRINLPQKESEFEEVVKTVSRHTLPGELERIAQNLALQLYTVEKLGKTINPFFIYSASPELKLVGEFIKYLGHKRLERLGGGILWDYLIGTTDQHSTAQFLGAGNNIAITTFINFLQEPTLNPPIIETNGLINERLNGKTPHEVMALYSEAVREALNNEERLTNTIEVPNEREENLTKLYLLLARISELYTRLWENENRGGNRLVELSKENESVVVNGENGIIKAGGYREESLQETLPLWITVFMHIAGITVKEFIHPQVQGLEGEVENSVNRFVSRLKVLAEVISKWQSITKNIFIPAVELNEQVGPEFYVFRLEDAIAKVEIGEELGETLWEEIEIKSVNTMIARTIQEIKRINPKAKAIVYTEDPNLTERRIKAVLNAIDAGGVFDSIVIGDASSVLTKITNQGWAKSLDEAMQRTVFASSKELENLKTVLVPTEKFISFPELVTVMQALLRLPNEKGRLTPEIIDSIISSYSTWLELAGFTKDEIADYIEELHRYLSSGTGLVVSLPIPPAPKPGSVIHLLDKEYEEGTRTKSFA